MRKFTLKIVQIKEKSYFLGIVSFGKRQYSKLNRMLYSWASHFLYVPFFLPQNCFWKKFCKKNPVKNAFFQQNQVHIAIFASEQLSCKIYNSKTVRFSAKFC